MEKFILFVIALLLIASVCFADIDMDAIAIIESSGNPDAISFRGAKYGRGLYQVSEECLKDYNYYVDDMVTAELFDPFKCFLVADWYFNERIPQMLKHYGIQDTIDNRIYAYSAGIGKMQRAKRMPTETKHYIRKYKELTQ